MVHGTGTRPRVLSLALVSLSVFGCSEQPSPSLSLEQRSAALAAGAAGGPAAANGGGGCRTSDSTCNAQDDDCDGHVDEDYASRCVFGTIALVCRDGHVTSESCDDGNPCTIDRCDAQGCHHTTACDDHNPCTADSCGPNGQCLSTPMAGSACDDGNACTTSDACTDAGSCRGVVALDPDDGNPCTVDTCDALAGALHTPNPGARCDDANPCTANDACTASAACTGTPRMDLDDGDPCTAEQCDPATGNVTHTPLAIGTSCSDEDACNGVETCDLLRSVFTIRAASTFYSADGGDAIEEPQIVRLSDIGLMPGMLVHFHTEGAYESPVSSVANVIFSSDSQLMQKTDLVRVPGAIQSEAPPLVTERTALRSMPTDIPQDFQVDTTELSVHIPEGAAYMFLGHWDNFYADNAGSLQLIVRTDMLGCVAGPAPVADDGNFCTADACDPTLGVVHQPIADGTSCESASGPGGCIDGECVAM